MLKFIERERNINQQQKNSKSNNKIYQKFLRQTDIGILLWAIPDMLYIQHISINTLIKFSKQKQQTNITEK